PSVREKPPRHRRARILLALCWFVFLALYVAAASSYPGANHFDPDAQSYHLWRNFICDVLHVQTIGGHLNEDGAALGTAAMVALVPGYVCLWWLLPLFFPRRPRLGRAVRTLGLLSGVCMVGVALTPSNSLPVMHAVFILLAGAPGLSAAVLGAFGVLSGRAAPKLVVVLAAGMGLSASIDMGLYIHHLVTGEMIVALPAIQKVAGLFFVALMPVVAMMAPATEDEAR
ncbi:MAG: hypothetical protein QF464_14990, partial [Myxococcota bacterium]|nr:hypothetical protein [Myxococcota bacterium]